MSATSWPHLDGVRHSFVSVRDAQVHYVEAGRGEPLVLLHGWPQHWWSFRKIIGPLARHSAATPWTGDGTPMALYRRVWHIWTLALLGRLALRALWLPAHALRAWRHAGRFTPEEMQTYLAPLRKPEAQQATARYYRGVVLRELPYFFRHFRTLRLITPTLHLNGARDPLTIGVPESHRRYAEDMRLELIPDAGHFLPEERPEELVARLHAFFGRRAARPGTIDSLVTS